MIFILIIKIKNPPPAPSKGGNASDLTLLNNKITTLRIHKLTNLTNPQINQFNKLTNLTNPQINKFNELTNPRINESTN